MVLFREGSPNRILARTFDNGYNTKYMDKKTIKESDEMAQEYDKETKDFQNRFTDTIIENSSTKKRRTIQVLYFWMFVLIVISFYFPSYIDKTHKPEEIGGPLMVLALFPPMIFFSIFLLVLRHKFKNTGLKEIRALIFVLLSIWTLIVAFIVISNLFEETLSRIIP